jgi:tRNA-dihydrouridine synthase
MANQVFSNELDQMKTTPAPTPETATIATIQADQLAGLCNLSRRRLYQLAEEKKIPAASNGKFPMLETIRALFSYYQADGKNLAHQRLEMARACREELKLKKERREVVILARVMDDWADVTLRFRQKILQIPGRIGSQTGDGAAAKIADSIVGDALRELSREILASADQPHAAWELPDEETPAEK